MSGEVRLSLRVQPSSPKNEVLGFREGILSLRITAPPRDGKANKGLIDFLAEKLGIAKSQIDIVKGHSSRNKVVAISGLSEAEVTGRLT
ncbi:MAG: DUF167 domain-containing protein [Chloroflexota bacterium]